MNLIVYVKNTENANNFIKVLDFNKVIIVTSADESIELSLEEFDKFVPADVIGYVFIGKNKLSIRGDQVLYTVLAKA